MMGYIDGTKNGLQIGRLPILTKGDLTLSLVFLRLPRSH